MNYIVSINIPAYITDISKALVKHDCTYNVYVEETGRVTQASIRRLVNAYRYDKDNCAFTITEDVDGVHLKLPAGTIGTLPMLSQVDGKALNKYRMVVLYKMFAPGGMSYTLFDAYANKVVTMAENELITYVQTYKHDACVSAAVVSRTQTNALYIRAFTGAFSLRTGESVKELYDVRQGVLCGLKYAPERTSAVLEMPTGVQRVEFTQVSDTLKTLLEAKHTLKMQTIPDNLSALLCISNINDVQMTDPSKPIDWAFCGNSLYDMRATVQCVYCLQSQTAESLVLTNLKQSNTVGIGANVLCKLHKYNTVILKNIAAVACDAFCGNTIQVLSIKGRMPVFAVGALRKLNVQSVQIYGEFTAEELARLLNIDVWWGIDELEENLKVMPAYKTVKFYCDAGTQTAKMLTQSLGKDRVIEVQAQ